MSRSAPRESHQAPDGRRFAVGERSCLCNGCWAAWCECGELLTAHDFDAEGARRGALAVLACADERPGFGHAVCAEPVAQAALDLR